jgi:Ca2+-binding RTX toxin-like protein
MSIINGTSGADELMGTDTVDTLNGGVGNDSLQGGSGADTYLFSRGDGIDEIYDESTEADSGDTVRFLDVKSTEVQVLRRQNVNLVISYGATDQLVVNAYFVNSHYQIEYIKFSDGVIWDLTDIKSHVIAKGTPGDDFVDLSLSGDKWDDLLDGGAGNDELNGGFGNDTYLFARGDGVDIIFDPDEDSGNNDTVQFHDVKSTELRSVERENYDLRIGYGSTDQITIQHFFFDPHAKTAYPIEQFKFNDGVTWDIATINSHGTLPNGTAGDDSIYGFDGKANRLVGLAGDDRLVGGTGNDTLVGGIGNDTLQGSSGGDAYLFSRGDGVDDIFDESTEADSGDTVQFLDVKSTELRALERKNDNLVVSYSATDQLIVNRYFNSASYQVEYFKFSDNVTWDRAYIQSQVINKGTADNDYIVLSGTGVNEDDVLDGGAGDDRLNGGFGNDTYLFARGDGVDVIFDPDKVGINIDTVQFQDVKSAELRSVTRKHYDLLISYGGTDQLTIQSFFFNPSFGAAYPIEQFKFSDGVTWDIAAINSQGTFPNGTAGDDSIYGFDGKANQLVGLAGNDQLVGGIGNDTLVGGSGDDSLVGGLGNDTYLFARGDGVDNISEEDRTAGTLDTVQFQDIKSTELRSLERIGSALVVSYGTSDILTITGHFSEPFSFEPVVGYRIEYFNFSDGVIWDDAAIKQRVVTYGSERSDQIGGYKGGPNKLFGLAGDDYLTGRDGNDTLIGGVGNDEMDGAAGNDTYVLERGDGLDTIRYNGFYNGNVETLQFLDVTSSEPLVVERRTDNLVISYGDADQVTIQGYFRFDYSQLLQIKFSDGIVWDKAAITSQGSSDLVGTSGPDKLYGFDGKPNQLAGLVGDDELLGGTGDDALDGGAGNDKLVGGAGNDLLLGGTGDDQLTGNAGNDVYLFAVGDGQDRIYYDGRDEIRNNDTTDKVDTVQFQDVKSTELRAVERSDFDLIISYGTSDQLTIGNFFIDDPSYLTFVEQVRFSDGVIWNGVASISSHVITKGTAGDDRLSGYNNGPNQYFGLAGNDSVHGASYNDTLDGGIGNDWLLGDDGNDTYLFQRGDGVDKVSDSGGSADTIQFRNVKSAELRTVENVSGDLVISYGDADQLTIYSYFNYSPSLIEEIKFSDGVTWDSAAVHSRATLVNGTAGNDKLFGLNGKSNQLLGLEGNDLIIGGDRNDIIDGGPGLDVARFSGNRSNYAITMSNGVLQVKDNSGMDGTDALSNIERVAFKDFSLAFDLTGAAGIVAHTLGAVFGAASIKDAALVGIGLYYANRGLSYEQLMTAAINAKLGSKASHGQVVDLLYSNLIGSLPDADTKAHYVSMLTLGTVTVAQLGTMAGDTVYNENNIGLTGLMQSGLEYVLPPLL